MKAAFTKIAFKPDTLSIINKAIEICEDYEAQGYELTLRQLYYQFVARGLLPNKVQSYNNLGRIINDARLTGDLDWRFIVDRTRHMELPRFWEDEAAILAAVAPSLKLDPWKGQKYHLEVWVEKDALSAVVSRPCNEFSVGYFACRGYPSQSEMYAAGMRLKKIAETKHVVILHLGDHDPSGINMTEDIAKRLDMFVGSKLFFDKFRVNRIGLTMEQIQQYDPPPNPAKENDSRFASYQENYGDESWELDALEPSVIAELVRSNIVGHLDTITYNYILSQEKKRRALLEKLPSKWQEVKKLLEQS